MTHDAEAHGEVAQLLPWFVNGTLSDDEHSRVERHVHECLSCYSMLQHERQLHELVRGQSTDSIPAEQSFERLIQRIDGPGRESRGRYEARLGRAARFVPAAAAAVVVLAVGALVWVGMGGSATGPGSYATATSSAAEAGVRVDVVFAESLSAAERRALLDEIGATIVAGPTDVGRYTIRVDGVSTDAQLTAVIERLRSDGRVRFAGRSYAAGGE